jgi:hypothetical protein
MILVPAQLIFILILNLLEILNLLSVSKFVNVNKCIGLFDIFFKIC